MNNRILVLGGYGAVGRNICTKLVADGAQVTVAGRNASKARAFANELGERATSKVINVRETLNYEVLSKVSLVINCVEELAINLAKICSQKGIHYIDISANYEYLESILGLKAIAQKSGAKMILGVGLAPGLTNLMAKQLLAESPNGIALDIFLMLGAGEKHGPEAVEWTLKNLATPFKLKINGQNQVVKSFKDRSRAPNPVLSKCSFYRLNISDQHSLFKTLKLTSVATWFTLDSYLALRLLKIFSPLLKNATFRRFFAKINKIFPFGSEKFAVNVALRTSQKNSSVSQSLVTGKNEAKATGYIAATIALLLLKKKGQPGIYYIDELFNLKELLAKLDNDILSWSP